MDFRNAVESDAEAISRLLQRLVARGKRTNPSSVDFARSQYISNPDGVQCTVAVEEDGSVLGLQVLIRTTPDNPYGVEPGWGIIGTHVDPDAARRGIGKTLFARTREAARRAGIRKIDAFIAEENAEGLAYYEAMGFRTYRTPPGKICKCYTSE